MWDTDKVDHFDLAPSTIVRHGTQMRHEKELEEQHAGILESISGTVVSGLTDHFTNSNEKHAHEPLGMSHPLTPTIGIWSL